MIRIMVSRSHQGDVMKMAEKFKPPGVVTPAGGAGYKVGRHLTTRHTVIPLPSLGHKPLASPRNIDQREVES